MVTAYTSKPRLRRAHRLRIGCSRPLGGDTGRPNQIKSRHLPKQPDDIEDDLQTNEADVLQHRSRVGYSE
ncbi:hypothetical protein AUR66_19035 [Haloferax profundi]|uniref:Uncharacterized protein n=1 Tax=Haloferax profundi TaxID=1544718 RepID=A0A0W1RLK9_9EURY|nr:hypothetical protein AUR66_19035 [Haloferax profundi]